MWLRMRVLYGAAAMSASVAVFAWLQDREERADQEQESAERVVSTDYFFAAMEQLPALTPQQRLEIRKFWRNLCNRHAAVAAGSPTAASGGALSSSANTGKAQRPIALGDVQRFAQEYKRVFPEIFPEQEVLLTAQRAAEATPPASWNGIVESTSSMIVSTSKRFQDIAADTKGGMQLAMHRTVRKYLERALDVVADRLKHAMKDPYMPAYLKKNIDQAVEQFMPDVKMEIFRKTRDLFRPNSASQLGSPKGREPVEEAELSVFYRVRGHILYHIFPYDKSIWMSFQDPWWIAFTCIGLFPVVSQLWWLFLFLIKDKTNEHQLCQFIVGFKSAQFITLGIFSMISGIAMYVKCITRGSLDLCQQGPALEPWNAFFFILQIALVWIAFFRLPYTDRPGENKLSRSGSSQEILLAHSRRRRTFHDVFGNELHMNRGGYLMKFCGYETVSFAIIVTLTCFVVWFPFEHWQRKALFYWIRTAYGLFSLPFIAFKIPLLANVLMHTRRMGYNERGETVKMVKKM